MGEYRATVARQEYQQMASRIAAPPQRDWTRITANASGFGDRLGAGRRAGAGARLPLHPLGFPLATAYGDHTTCFFPLFVAWLAKLIILKAGGLKLYRRGIPFFLGLTSSALHPRRDLVAASQHADLTGGEPLLPYLLWR